MPYHLNMEADPRQVGKPRPAIRKREVENKRMPPLCNNHPHFLLSPRANLPILGETPGHHKVMLS